MTAARCAHCGTSLEGRRSHARFCCGACRVAAYRGDTWLELVRECDVCGTSLIGQRANARFCSGTCRASRHKGKGQETVRKRSQAVLRASTPPPHSERSRYRGAGQAGRAIG